MCLEYVYMYNKYFSSLNFLEAFDTNIVELSEFVDILPDNHIDKISYLRKKKIDTAKETTTVRVPTVPESVFPIFFPKKTLNKNPTNGVNNNSKTKFFSIRDYPFKFFKLAISIEPTFL